VTADLPVMPDTVMVKGCCDAIEGDVCDCADFLAGLTTAPVIFLPAPVPYGRTHR
jgi:hypothetical protein